MKRTHTDLAHIMSHVIAHLCLGFILAHLEAVSFYSGRGLLVAVWRYKWLDGDRVTWEIMDELKLPAYSFRRTTRGTSEAVLTGRVKDEDPEGENDPH